MNRKYSKKAVLLGSCLSVVAIALAGTSLYTTPSDRSAGVTLKEFSAGTEVDYEILVDGKAVQNGSETVGHKGEVDLPVPQSAIQETAVTYRLSVDPAEENAEDLDLSLKFEIGKAGLDLKGRGLKEFSDITLNYENGVSEKVSADWSGMFVAQARKSGVTEDIVDDKTIELAFQNANNLSNEMEQYAPGKIEVLFGDSSGSNVGRVQDRYSWALARMTEELSAVMVLQTEAIGMFFDANIQLDTQRKLQELHARAHKDYHPSDQMCRIGTFMRSVAHTESKSEINKHTLNRVLMNQYMAMQNSSADGGSPINQEAKQYEYIQNYCDRRDNNGAVHTLCPSTAATTVAQRERLNKDIDYVRTLAGKLTLDVDYNDQSGAGNTNVSTDEEEDIIALAKNLYFPKSFQVPDEDILDRDLRPQYSSRAYAAKMNVAHSTFLNIVGMKSSAPAGQATTATATSPATPPQIQSPRNPAPPVLTEDAGWAYMKALLREFGITDTNGDGSTTDEIEAILGERPSYYAQMEVLTKKIYQHPNFYTNLYDKPANVKRIGASIDAITLMNQRDRFESMLRTEMLTSLLVEEELQPHVEEVNTLIYEGMQKIQRP